MDCACHNITTDMAWSFFCASGYVAQKQKQDRFIQTQSTAIKLQSGIQQKGRK